MAKSHLFSAMVRPHVAIITTIAPVHLEYFESLNDVANTKAEIFSGLVQGGVAILNRDIAEYERLLAHAKASPAGHVASFGEHDESRREAGECDAWAWTCPWCRRKSAAIG